MQQLDKHNMQQVRNILCLFVLIILPVISCLYFVFMGLLIDLLIDHL